MRTFLRCALVLWLLAAAAAADPKFPIPESSRQAVLVLSTSWDDPTAQMWRFERASAEAPWKAVGAAVPVNLGRKGLGWGYSSLIEEADPASTKGPHKKEGDGKSPAGLFFFLQAFGHPGRPQGYSDSNLPFLLVDAEQCVDDKNSKYYNTIVNPKETGGVSWDSAEKMKIDLYEMGLVVGHNCPAARPGMGSCIFFHLQSAPKEPTSGCTSMDGASLSQLMLWLKADAEPVLLQLPRARFESLRDASWPRP